MSRENLTETGTFPGRFDRVMKIGGDCSAEFLARNMNVPFYYSSPFCANLSFDIIKNTFLLLTKGVTALNINNMRIVHDEKTPFYHVHDTLTDNFYKHSPLFPENLSNINKVKELLHVAKNKLNRLCEQTYNILNQPNKNILLIHAGYRVDNFACPINCTYNLDEAKASTYLLNSHFKGNITLLYLNTGTENKIDVVSKNLIAIQHTLPRKRSVRNRSDMITAMFGNQLNKLTQSKLIKYIVNENTKLIACQHAAWEDLLVINPDTNINYRTLRPDHTFDVLEHTNDTIKVKWHKFGTETFKARQPDTFPIYWRQ